MAAKFQESLLRAKRRVRETTGLIRTIRPLPYRGFGNQQRLFLYGRVVEAKGLRSPHEDDGRWQNLVLMYRRFTSTEIRGTTVSVSYAGQQHETVTDRDGFFHFELPNSSEVSPAKPWIELDLKLHDDRWPAEDASAWVLVPPPQSDFGVISDMDDTIIETHATDLIKMLRVTFLNNARTRLPFPGVGAFYRALLQGPSGQQHNPIFYVSSSAWNLYDLFEDFLDINGIPPGPLLLRNTRVEQSSLLRTRHEHKLAKIERLMGVYPELSFVLIGDAGQDDPILYRQAAERYPERIRAIYIRDVASRERSRRAAAVAREVTAAGTEMLLVSKTDEAADHALAAGLIHPDSLPAIQADEAAEELKPTPLQQLLDPTAER